MDEHASFFCRGPAEVYQWIGHPMRATLCRMKSGSILTGVGDKILRLWSAESCKYMNEYNVPNAKMLVDFDFDENKAHIFLITMVGHVVSLSHTGKWWALSKTGDDCGLIRNTSCGLSWESS